MGKTKKYFYDYEQYEDGKNSVSMIKEILEDPEFLQVMGSSSFYP